MGPLFQDDVMLALTTYSQRGVLLQGVYDDDLSPTLR